MENPEKKSFRIALGERANFFFLSNKITGQIFLEKKLDLPWVKRNKKGWKMKKKKKNGKKTFSEIDFF